MEIIKITERETELLEALVLIWEDSVRQTHTFLEEADIEALRPLVRQGLEFIPELWVLKAAEMLFIESSMRGQGGGSKLLGHAVSRLGVTEVDVNEQNPQAYGFYQKYGFKKYARSELDGQGKPFPILHLRCLPGQG